MATVTLDKLTKIFPNGTTAVSNLDLRVADGEFMVLVGPSGCGKTTALRMVAGLEEITGGTVRIGDRVVNELSPKERDVAMVFQNYALYPHMTVARNIGFALRLKKVPKQRIDASVKEAAKILGLSEHLDRKPAQLSGGQRQRVAMGRAIVREPSVFLMDEPLSNLDAKLRVQMRAEISEIQHRLGVATLYVTHDQTEAMTMGDRVAVLRSGVLQQCQAPQAIYDRPGNVFVAAFIGSPAMNLYEGTLSPDGSAVRLGSQTLSLPDRVRSERTALRPFNDHKLLVGIRPEHLSDASLERAELNGATLVGDVKLVEALGSELMVHFHIDAARVHSEDAAAASEEEEEELVDLASGGSELAARDTGVARVQTRSQVRASERATFVVDTERLHFFDPQSGAALWN
ncbi:MAG: sn-glycerol-3-phosphate ABC transporter ATP-binding protein UgpC [Solirubrobacterales bacterium]|nr:sn-glycerol-3-phosphate ABC transporter ATP-binding protein UgpC [Solirubrobacterales bacterium]